MGHQQVLDRIQKHFDQLTQGQRLVAVALAGQPQLLTFGTAAEIGRAVGVSESTVIRLAHVLDYKGFTEMQEHAQASLAPKLMPDFMDQAASQFPQGTGVLGRVIEHDIGLLRQTLATNAEAFEQAVELLTGAKQIYITGGRSSHSVAEFLWYTLRLQLGNATFLPGGNQSFYTDLAAIGPESALVAIAFPRYSEATVNTVRYAAEQGCPVLAITDNPLSPIGRLAKVALTTSTETVATTMSYVPVLSLATALITGVALRNKARVEEHLRRTEAATDAWKRISQTI